MIGFKEVRWRMQCQEQETALHQAFLDKVAEEVQTLQRKQAATVAKTTEYRRKLVELEHRLLQVRLTLPIHMTFPIYCKIKFLFQYCLQLLVKQEITRKVGLALTPEEEAIRGHLESLQPHMYAPTHLKVNYVRSASMCISVPHFSLKHMHQLLNFAGEISRITFYNTNAKRKRRTEGK